MYASASRREFLQRAAVAGAAAGLGDLAFLAKLRPVSAAEAAPNPKGVRLESDIEPLVTLLEGTPREKLLEEVATKVRGGTSYREVLAALLLAGVKNVQPRPSVGFKFHAVLVVNAAHLASISSPEAHRWLPVFWALDHFKDAQAQDVREGDWTMAPVDESAMPSASKAREAFTAALDQWDAAKADVATAALVRSDGMHDVFELLFRYGARDFRDIGHKAIFVANSLRTLNCIGWRHAEPVLRSLAYALVKYDGGNPASSDHEADRPWRSNLVRAGKLRADWPVGRIESAATSEMLAVLRQASPDEACDKAVEVLNRGIAPQSVWDALFVGSTELLMRQPGIVALHAVTSSNALHFAWQTSANDATRRMLLLQDVAFVTMFRDAMRGRGQVGSFELDRLEAAPFAGTSSPTEQVFADVGPNTMSAARKLFGYLESGGSAKQAIDAARLLIFLKGNNAHDYKFSSAALEDYVHVSPAWRNRFLAGSVFNLRGSSAADNALVQRTRAALSA